MADYQDAQEVDIEIVMSESKADQFNQNMHDIFYSTRPGHDECLLRCKVLNLVNNIWQQYLIEKEQNAMINKSNKKYADIITEETSIEIRDLQSGTLKPFRRGSVRSGAPLSLEANQSLDSPESVDLPPDSLSRPDGSPPPAATSTASHGRDWWRTPIEGMEQEIIIRQFDDGPIVKQIRIPSVMIFGSIAFGLDGPGSDIDLALPAGIDQPAVNAHHDGKIQVKLLREFVNRLKLNMASSRRLGLEWKLEPILHARVPIVKLTEKKLTGGSLSVDVGIRSTQMPITKLIRHYCAYDDRVSVFYMFIKQWSKVRRISDAMYGFPNSFGFVMLATKFLQLTEEPVIPIVDYDRAAQRIQTLHSLEHFRRNEQSLLELAVAFFDFFATFDFETYQISITSAGLQWKHAGDYNLNHDDQGTMLIEDPSASNENVTRCLKPYNMRIMKEEFFRAYKCAKHGDWALLFKPYDDRGERSIFEVYPPEDEWEQEMRYEIEHYDEDWEYEEYHDQHGGNERYYDNHQHRQKRQRQGNGGKGGGGGQFYGNNGSKMKSKGGGKGSSKKAKSNGSGHGKGKYQMKQMKPRKQRM